MLTLQIEESVLRAQDNGAILNLFQTEMDYYVCYNMFPYKVWKIDKERFDEWMQFMNPEVWIDEKTGIKQWDAKHWSEI